MGVLVWKNMVSEQPRWNNQLGHPTIHNDGASEFWKPLGNKTKQCDGRGPLADRARNAEPGMQPQRSCSTIANTSGIHSATTTDTNADHWKHSNTGMVGDTWHQIRRKR